MFSFFLVHFEDLRVLFSSVLNTRNEGDTIPFLLQDGLNVSGQLDRLLDLSRSFLQNLVSDFFSEPAQEHGIHHEQLHPFQALGHDGVGVGLVQAVPLANEGGSVVWLGPVGVPECLRNSVVESLDILAVALLEILEGYAQGFG